MRAWAILLGGLVVWAVHFFALYAIGGLFPGEHFADRLILAVSIPAILADIWIVHTAVRRLEDLDPLLLWIHQIGAISGGLSLLAVIWQSITALTV